MDYTNVDNIIVHDTQENRDFLFCKDMNLYDEIIKLSKHLFNKMLTTYGVLPLETEKAIEVQLINMIAQAYRNLQGGIDENSPRISDRVNEQYRKNSTRYDRNETGGLP